MDSSMIFNNIEFNIREIQETISKINKVELPSDDFYKKMIELTNAHPEAYDLIQAMLMIVSKMETSNKVFKESIIEHSTTALDLKKNTVSIIKEHAIILENLEKNIAELEAAISTKEHKDITTAFKNWVHNPKNFGKFLLASFAAAVFILIITLESLNPKLLHTSINVVISIFKWEKIQDFQNKTTQNNLEKDKK